MSIVVAVCENFAREAAAALEPQHDVTVATFPADCGRPPLDRGALSGAIERSRNGWCAVVGGDCCSKLADDRERPARLSVHRLPLCFQLLVQEELVDGHVAAGAYLVTPGWLACWRERIARLGLDDATAPMLFGDSATRVVLLDTGVDASSSGNLAEFARFAGLPAETVRVGLDHARQFFGRVVLEGRLEAERRDSLAALRAASRQSADHAAALDLVGVLTRIATEKEAVRQVLDVCTMLFAPRRVVYTALFEGAPTLAESFPASQVDPAAGLARLAELGDGQLLTPGGFALRIEHQGQVLGVLEVEGLAFPEQRERYLALALTVGKVCGLAVANARTYDRVKRAEEALAVERERLAVTLESIGDAVFATDTEGRVTLLNRVAEELTGWPRADAAGKPVGEVFQIVDERTGAPAEDPVRKVLDLGAVVGLANHTALVRRDGSRLSIADSAAPIRASGGETLGVVLVFRDVTEARRAEVALREADERKNEFLAVLSHELRNPLTPIRNSLVVLDRAPPAGEQATRARAVIDRQVTHLARLVDDLLDVTRISRGKILLQRERFELGDLVRRTVEDHRTTFVANGIQLEGRIASEAMWVTGDATRIAQVVGNLLGNAAKFTPRGGRVDLTLEQRDAAARLRVRDTGVGIAADVFGRLFQPFTQSEQTLDRSRGGLGLGLALVKGIVELHGGTVSAASEGPGRGAELIVCLPLAAAPVEVAPATDAPASQRRRVLVIEDNVDAADSLKEALELMGHEARVAYDGPSGIAAAREFRPELVLCDIGLPDMNGYEVARRFQADPVLREIVLVALTGYALPEDQKRAVEAGFTRHVPKPPSLEVLERVLAEP